MTSISKRLSALAAFALWLIAVSPVEAQGPLTCTIASGVPLLIRADGRAEMAGDLILSCAGGLPAANGQPVAQYNFQIFVNTGTTGRLLSDPWSEALLLIDEPPPASQLVCGDPAAPAAPTGVCSITGNGTGVGLYDGSRGHPNVFQGQSAGNGSIFFAGVPIDPPGWFGPGRTMRITNVRVDAFGLGIPAPGGPPTQVSFKVSSNLPLNNYSEIFAVGLGVAGQQFSVPSPPTLQQCAAQNGALATDPSSIGTPQFQLNFKEGFATAFKPMNIAPVVNFDLPPPLADQNQPEGVYSTETGFFNHLFPTVTGQGNLALAGLPMQGTRLIARFIDVPAGVQLFGDSIVHMTPNSNSVLRMVQTGPFGGGPFSAAPANSFGIAPLAGSGSTRTAVYEVMTADPSVFEQANIPIYVAYNANAPSAPGMGTVLVAGGFAPWTTDNLASATDSVPRFAPPASALAAFTIASCQNQCGVDVSTQTAVARGQANFSQALKVWVQYVSIQNTSANPIQGPLSLALDNISSTAVLANPTGFTRCDAPAGHPYLNVSLGAGTTLAPGQKVFAALAFSAASAQNIAYSTRVLAGAGNR